jgi:hypothetical protein
MRIEPCILGFKYMFNPFSLPFREEVENIVRYNAMIAY